MAPVIALGLNSMSQVPSSFRGDVTLRRPLVLKIPYFNKVTSLVVRFDLNAKIKGTMRDRKTESSIKPACETSTQCDKLYDLKQSIQIYRLVSVDLFQINFG